MLLVDHGKTNAYGKAEYGCAIRHRDGFACPIGALALYLVWMFHVEKEKFFEFGDRTLWYKKHILHGGLTREHEWDYNKQKRMYQTAFPKVFPVVAANLTKTDQTARLQQAHYFLALRPIFNLL
jgi:hypothetical protein